MASDILIVPLAEFALIAAVVVGWINVYLLESVPEIVKPEIVTVLPSPTSGSENVPIAVPPNITSSFVPLEYDTTPTKFLLVVFNVVVAGIIPSYTLSDAVIPVTINDLVFTVIEQVVLAAA